MSEEERDVIEFLKFCGKTHIDSFTVKRKHINKIVSAINNLEKENKELKSTIEQLEDTIVELSTAMEE